MRAIAAFFGKMAHAFLVAEPYIIFLLVHPFADMPEGFLMRMVECLAIVFAGCWIAWLLAWFTERRLSAQDLPQETVERELKKAKLVRLAHLPAYIACLLLGIWWWRWGTTEPRLRAFLLWGAILVGLLGDHWFGLAVVQRKKGGAK